MTLALGRDEILATIHTHPGYTDEYGNDEYGGYIPSTVDKITSTNLFTPGIILSTQGVTVYDRMYYDNIGSRENFYQNPIFLFYDAVSNLAN